MDNKILRTKLWAVTDILETLLEDAKRGKGDDKRYRIYLEDGVYEMLTRSCKSVKKELNNHSKGGSLDEKI